APELPARIAQLLAERRQIVRGLDLLLVVDALLFHEGPVDDDRLADIVARESVDALADGPVRDGDRAQGLGVEPLVQIRGQVQQRTRRAEPPDAVVAHPEDIWQTL